MAAAPGRAKPRYRGGDASGPIAPATAADDAREKRQAAARDRAIQRAYQAGKTGRRPPVATGHGPTDEFMRRSYDQGVEERGNPEPSRSRQTDAGDSGGRFGTEDGAGLLLGVFAWALILNFVRGGPAQARGWLAAKFLNKPYQVAKTFGSESIPAARPSAPSVIPAHPAAPRTP